MLGIADMRAPICPDYNRLVLAMAGARFPMGFDLSDNVPHDDAESFAFIALRGRMLVWSGASDRTQFCDASVNYAARAWHDWHHIDSNGAHGFSYHGESMVCVAQCNAILDSYGDNAMTRRFVALTRIDIIGQIDYVACHGGTFPLDQWEFTQNALKG